MIEKTIAFGSGLVFALGLGIGGMTRPAKIVGFLDVAGHWDPSLVFVLAGAVGTYMLLFRWIRRQRRPVYALQFQIPTVRAIDTRLVLGAALFGIGWGIGGFCPGPALTALVTVHPTVLLFVLAMVAGIVLFEITPLGSRGLRRRNPLQPARDRAPAAGQAPPAFTDA